MIGEEAFWALLALGALGIAFVIHFLVFCGSKKPEKQQPDKEISEVSSGNEDISVKGQASKNSKRSQAVKGKSKGIKGGEKHPLQAADLKGHTGAVLDLDFSQDGKYLASCSTGTKCTEVIY